MRSLSRTGEALSLGVLLVTLSLAATTTALAIWIGAQSPSSDFYGLYGSALALRRGENPYADYPNLNPPAMIALLMPLTILSAVPAFWTWSLISIVTLGFVVTSSAHAVGMRDSIWPGGLMFATTAVSVDLKLGQMGGIIAGLVTWAWLSDRQRRALQAGVALGIASYMKPFLAILLLYWLWRRQWRSLGWAAVAIVTMTGLGTWVAGPASYLAWIDRLRQIEWMAHPLNASTVGLATRVFALAPGRLFVSPMTILSPAIVRLIVVTLDGVGALALLRLRGATVDRAWAILLLLSIWLSPLGWIYYLPITIGPLLALWHSGTTLTRTLLLVGWGFAAVPPAPTFVHLGPWATLSWGSCASLATLTFLISATIPTRQVENQYGLN
jgi:hypothetical protein